MTAPDQCCIMSKKLLSIRRRPHMTQSGHCARSHSRMRVTLPRYSDPAFPGIALTAVGELAIKARIQPGVRPDGELGAGVDARGVARGAPTIDPERVTGQRDEGGIDRASGIELVHPRQPRV